MLMSRVDSFALKSNNFDGCCVVGKTAHSPVP